MNFTKNDTNIIESMIRNGATAEEIAAKANEIATRIKTEEAAKKKAEQDAKIKAKSEQRDAARTRLIESVINYALEFGWMEQSDIQQDDIDMLDKALRAEEKVLDNAKEFSEKLFKGGTVSSDLDNMFERLMDGLMGDLDKGGAESSDRCKCGGKCDVGDCSKSKEPKSLIDQISELLKQ